MFGCHLRNLIANRLIGKCALLTPFSNATVSKSDLSKLRKISGFSFSKCKEALVKFDNFDEAHSWLKSEAEKHGWNKMGKLAERPMSNGLIGLQLISHQENLSCGIMLEINCETDFVARNQNFHKLIHTASSAFMHHFSEVFAITSTNPFLNSHSSFRRLTLFI